VQALRAGQTLTETFAYTASDGRGGLSTANLVVTINGQNDAPTVTGEARTINEDTAPPLTGNVITNDRDVDGGVLSVAAVNGVAGNVGVATAGTYGSIVIGANGAYSYLLNNASPAVQALRAGQTAADVFTYSVSDGQGGLSTTTLTVTVNGVNDAPVVTLNTGGNAIAAATFALGLDSAVLHFDTTDADADGVPDAITLNTPAGMSRSASWNATAKRLEVAVFGMSLPLPTLTDGTLATVSIAVANDTSATSTPLALDLVSFSDADGHDLPFTEQDGTLTIDTSNVQRSLFLPLVVRY
jgi:VCBS repeat-containing protein